MSAHLKIYWRRPRRALLLPELNVYPETPFVPALNYPSILPPQQFKRRDIRRLGLHAPPIPSRIAPPVTVALYPSFVPPPTLRRRDIKRIELHAPPIPPRIAPPVTAVIYPSYVLERARFIVNDRVLITPRELNEYAEPIPPPDEPAWKLPPVLRWHFIRTRLRLPHVDVFPETPPSNARSIQFRAFTTREQASRRIQPVRPVAEYVAGIAAPLAPFTAYLAVAALRRRETTRTHYHAPDIPPRIAPPVTAALYPSYLPPEVNRSDFHRSRLSVPRLDEYPSIPVVVIPYPSWVPPSVFLSSFKRRVQTVAIPRQQPKVRQDSSRWYENDNANVNATTALVPQDTKYVVKDLTQILHLRVRIDNVGLETAIENIDLRASKNFGTYLDVTAASSNIRVVDGAPADGDSTTERLTGSAFPFTAGEYDESSGDVDVDVPASGQTEIVFSLGLVAGDNVPGDSYRFLILYNGLGIEVIAALPALTVETFPANFLPPKAFRTSFKRTAQVLPLLPTPILRVNPLDIRLYDDDNADVNATTLVVNAGVVKNLAVGRGYHLRYRVENNGTLPALGGFTLKVSRNGSGFTTVTDLTSFVRIVDGQPTDGDATTERQSGGTKEFVAGEYDDVNGVVPFVLLASRLTELVWALEFVKGEAQGGDTYQFVLNLNDGFSFLGGASLIAHINLHPAEVPPRPKFTRFVRQLQVPEEPNEYPVTPVLTSPYPSWVLPPTHQTSFERVLHQPRQLNERPATPAPGAPPYPSWVPPAQHSIRFDRKLQSVAEIDEYPASIISDSKVTTPIVPFVTRSQRSRRVLKLAHNPVYEFVPTVSEAPLTAWMLPVHHYRPQAQGLFLTPDAAFRARPTVPWPSYIGTKVLHSSFERKLITPLHRVPWPFVQTITAVVYPAHMPGPTHRQRFVRQIQKLPQTPDRVLLAAPYSAWTIEPDYHLFARGLDRKHLHAGFPPEYPISPDLPFRWEPKDDKGPLTGAPKNDGGALTIGSCEDGGPLTWTPE